MKNRFATIILVSVLGLTGVGLVGCGEPNPNAQYTGSTVVDSTNWKRLTGTKIQRRTNAHRCDVTVTFPDGATAKIEAKDAHSRKACDSIKVGGKATLAKGKLVSYDKK